MGCRTPYAAESAYRAWGRVLCEIGSSRPAALAGPNRATEPQQGRAKGLRRRAPPVRQPSRSALDPGERQPLHSTITTTHFRPRTHFRISAREHISADGPIRPSVTGSARLAEHRPSRLAGFGQTPVAVCQRQSRQPCESFPALHLLARYLCPNDGSSNDHDECLGAASWSA